MMDHAALLEEFENAGALLSGHFILTSGRHSDRYFNKSALGQYPDRTARVCSELARRLGAFCPQAPKLVLSPVLGAIVFGYEVARHLGTPFFFMEREGEGFALRRGYTVAEGTPAVVVEDIVTTGLSARCAVEAARHAGADVMAVGCLVDRSNGAADVGAPLVPLLRLDVKSYAPDEVPAALAAIPVTKPGSRELRA
jgi:orotate phosphoribosyltransferase